VSTFDTGSGGGTYNSAGRDPSSSSFDPDEEFGFSESGPTSVLPSSGGSVAPPFGSSPFDEDDRARKVRWTGAADFGLLVLRIVVGGAFVGQGLMHVFGLFHGNGLHDFENMVKAAGYADPGILAWVAGGAELVGGGLLVLGLLTPVASAALLALLSNTIFLKWKIGFFPPGYELEAVLSAATFALLFVGPGRVSLDRPTPWFRRPGVAGWIFLIVAAAVSVVFLLVLRNH
jgi:putative oxidoreductase